MPTSSAEATHGVTQPAAELRGVGVRYGATRALTDVDLRIGSGQRVALVGPSGAGKTSLLGVLAGLVEASEGSASVLGEDLACLSGRALRRHRSRVGVVSQALHLAPTLRVIHNVNAGRLGAWSTAAGLMSLLRPVGRDRVEKALRDVGLAGKVDASTGSLSGGEQQRVAVARVLVQRPDLVLADEPVSSIDPRLSGDVLSLLCGPLDRAPWSTVVSLHEPALARRFCERMVGVRGGRVLFDRPSDQVSDADLDELYRDSR